MKRLGCFDSYLIAHFAAHPAPPAIEELAAQFLASLAEHDHPLLRAVAQLELFSVESAQSSAHAITLVWDRDPQAAMLALDRFQPLPNPTAGVRYRLRLSPNQPASCLRESWFET